jgi:hypothetical protein
LAGIHPRLTWNAARVAIGQLQSRSEPAPSEAADTRIVHVMQEGLDPEDVKIITLARSARARVDSAEGAAVRDETGRTYAAAAVALPSLRLSALTLAVAMAVSSGAVALEAAAVVSDGPGPTADDIRAVKDIGAGALIIHAGSDGTVRSTSRP